MINLFSHRSPSLFVSAVLSVLLLSFAFVFKPAVAQENSGDKPAEDEKPKVEMLECKVKVVDPDGFPVEDAMVFCTGLRSKEESSSHWGWSEKEFGKRPSIKTDSKGIAVMPYPKMLAEGQTTGKMTWSVEHPAFVNFREDRSVEADPATIQLEQGFRIALTAKETDGERITENLHAVTSFAGGGKWDLKKNGTLVSGVMKRQNGFLRVVCFEEGEPTLFSDEIEIKPGDKSRVLLKSIELSPGGRIEGSLDDSVLRPVKNGYVIARIYKRDPELRGSRWRWADETKIDAEGNFVFESLPKGEAVQMIPICDGFVPAKPELDEVLAVLPVTDPNDVRRQINSFASTPHLVKSEGDKVTVKLSMKKAYSVKIKLIDQNGKPLQDLKVGAWPNQYWFNGGSNILGKSVPTRKMWELSQTSEDINSYVVSKGSPYLQKTDENGIAYLKNMSVGKHGIAVNAKEWEMPIGKDSGDRIMQIQVGEMDLDIEITLYPQGSLPRNN